MAAKIENHADLQVYQKAMETAMSIFQMSKSLSHLVIPSSCQIRN